jgi:hypothetical protein
MSNVEMVLFRVSENPPQNFSFFYQGAIGVSSKKPLWFNGILNRLRCLRDLLSSERQTPWQMFSFVLLIGEPLLVHGEILPEQAEAEEALEPNTTPHLPA